jgi:transposase
MKGEIEMMGQQAGDQAQLFYAFNLDQHIPPDHLLRGIDRFLDLSDLRQRLAPFYSEIGRPSIAPALMIRMLVVGYCFGIRSERRLCEEVHLNLAYRWFCRLGLNDPVPDHSSFSKNRLGRFRDGDTFRHLFENSVRRCMSEGLVKGEGFAIDASLIKADVSRQRAVSGADLASVDWGDPKRATRAVQEYLDGVERENPIETVPKSVSLTDPGARWTAADGPAFFGYSTNYLIDLHAGVIVDVQACGSTLSNERDAARIMIDRVEATFAIKPDRLVGDTAYGSGPLLGWIVNEKQIAPHIPVWDKSEREDGTLSSNDFQWDEKTDEYRCPQGHALRRQWRSFKTPRTHVTQDGTIKYRASQFDCATCPIKARCCPNTPVRTITRSVHEAARDVARAIAKTDAYKQSRHDRKKVEMLFAHLKRILKFDRLRLRGPKSAQDEFLLAATAQNLRRLAIWFVQAPPKLQSVTV